MLRFTEIQKTFEGGGEALAGVSLDIAPGEFCVVLGPSGAGKSTLLRVVNGLTWPSRGKVEVDGRLVSHRTVRHARRAVSMIHQQFHLTHRASVLTNVLAGALHQVPTWRALLGWFPTELQRKACRLLHEVGLDEDMLYRRAAQLSGGQQQRVAIARAFILDPKVVLADEPVASLDVTSSERVMELLKDTSARHGTTVLCSLHQVDLARRFADRIVGMRQGRVVYDGVPGSLGPAELEQIYGRKSETS